MRDGPHRRHPRSVRYWYGGGWRRATLALSTLILFLPKADLICQTGVWLCVRVGRRSNALITEQLNFGKPHPWQVVNRGNPSLKMCYVAHLTLWLLHYP